MIRRLFFVIDAWWNRLHCRLFGCELMRWNRQRREFRCRRCKTVYTLHNLSD